MNPGKQASSVDSFKKMCRLLEFERRTFLERDWKNYSAILPRGQFLTLMNIRLSMPCNLGKIMTVTGLTSAGASIFVDKLVKAGLLRREDDPADRRNVCISLTEKGAGFTKQVDDKLNGFIFSYFSECSHSELETLEKAARIVCEKVGG